MYKNADAAQQAQQQAGAQAGAQQAQSDGQKDEKVVDADYTVVDDDKK